MKAMGLAVAQDDGWRYIAISLIDRCTLFFYSGFSCSAVS
jgi:hypothetical protein